MDRCRGTQKLSSLAEEGSGGLKYSEAAEVTKYGVTQEAVSRLLPKILIKKIGAWSELAV